MLNNENNIISSKTKTYWPGKIRLLSDIFWCFCLITFSEFMSNSIGNISDGIIQFPILVLGCFFTFFFWSWNNGHVKCIFARRAIHVLCWIWFTLCFSIILSTYIYYSSLWLCGIIGLWYGGWAVLVAKKYSELMRPENPKFYIIDMIKHTINRAVLLAQDLTSLGLEKFHGHKPIVKYTIVAVLLYLIFFPLFNRWLGLRDDITTIPSLIILALLNKTVWFYLFLFWFSWNLLSILRSLNDTWIKSLEQKK